MYSNISNINQINDHFATASRQFAATAAQVNRLALDNAQTIFGLQVAAIEQNMHASFAFFGELTQARDLDGLKTVMPKGIQVARKNVERSISTGQEVLERSLKTSDSIAQVARHQFETANAQAQANTETAVNTAAERVHAAAATVAKASRVAKSRGAKVSKAAKVSKVAKKR